MSAVDDESGPATRRSALVTLLVSAARLDRTQSDPVVSARNAIGTVLPLIVGALFGNAAYGLPATIGALETAFADRPGPYRLRLLRMLGTALASGVTTGLAVVASDSLAGSTVLLLVLGFVAGLLVTGGPSAAQVGIAGTAAALVLGHVPESASAAPHVAWLVLVGGAGQAVFALAGWPLGRHLPERRALADAYRQLARIARRPPGTGVGPPAGETLTGVRSTLYGLGHDHGATVEAYRVLLDEAEGIRRELLVLAGEAERLSAAGEHAASEAVGTVLTCAAGVLDEVGASLADGRAVDSSILDPVRARVDEQVDALVAAAPAAGQDESAVADAPDAPAEPVHLTARAAAARARNLVGRLRVAVETARTGAAEGRSGGEPDVYGVHRLRDPVAVLRANLAPDSAVVRHAIRVAVLVAGSDLMVRLDGVDRGYWVPLTALVVLRPDFATTYQRATMRILGTMLGLLLATGLVHLAPGGPWYAIALTALFFFGMRLAGPGNYGLSAVSLAALVVILLELDGVAAHTTVQLRALDTVIGGALALLAVLLTPLWERTRLPDALGALFAAYRNYLAAITAPDADAQRRQRARMASRRARSNALTSVRRARSEPVRSRGRVELGETVLVHSHRLVHALLTVDSVRTAVGDRDRVPEFDAFASAVAGVLTACEQAVRAGRAPRGTVKLRPLQEALVAALTRDPGQVGDLATAGVLIDATDRIANSADTLLAELRRQLAG